MAIAEPEQGQGGPLDPSKLKHAHTKTNNRDLKGQKHGRGREFQVVLESLEARLTLRFSM